MALSLLQLAFYQAITNDVSAKYIIQSMPDSFSLPELFNPSFYIIDYLIKLNNKLDILEAIIKYSEQPYFYYRYIQHRTGYNVANLANMYPTLHLIYLSDIKLIYSNYPTGPIGWPDWNEVTILYMSKDRNISSVRRMALYVRCLEICPLDITQIYAFHIGEFFGALFHDYHVGQIHHLELTEELKSHIRQYLIYFPPRKLLDIPHAVFDMIEETEIEYYVDLTLILKNLLHSLDTYLKEIGYKLDTTDYILGVRRYCHVFYCPMVDLVISYVSDKNILMTEMGAKEDFSEELKTYILNKIT
jgi:hypothetical protein